jgi:HSP20 family protein
MKKQHLMQTVLKGVFIAGLLTAGGQALADDTTQLREQVQALQNRVNQLESQLGNTQQVTAPAPMPVYDQWEDPFAQMVLMREQNIPYFLLGSPHLFADTAAFAPKMDMKQTNDKYIITMDIPGMDKDKINVEIKEGTLVISGERQSETKDNKNNQYYRQERFFGSFMQAIPLPKDAKTDQVDARYKNGVLTVTLSRMKKEEKKSEEQKITVE